MVTTVEQLDFDQHDWIEELISVLESINKELKTGEFEFNKIGSLMEKMEVYEILRCHTNLLKIADEYKSMVNIYQCISVSRWVLTSFRHLLKGKQPYIA